MGKLRSGQDAAFADVAILGNLRLGTAGLNGAAPTKSAGVLDIEHLGLVLRRSRFTLEDFQVSVPAANDFGTGQLGALPNSNLLIVGARVDLTVVVDGTAIALAEDLDFALGTIASTGVTTGDLDDGVDILDETSAVGAAVSGTAIAHSFANASPALIFLDAGASNGVHLNVEATVASGTGTADFTGVVEVFHFDLGS